ncbi:hypothetical protein BOQ64_23140 [Chryseobacterium sp. CH25]|nr:hypothetical protein BOQ64_23140 [Chryseobacterium sp. CH25]
MELTPSKTSENRVQYFDGFGKTQARIVNVKASPLGRDMVIHIEYNGTNTFKNLRKSGSVF